MTSKNDENAEKDKNTSNKKGRKRRPDNKLLRCPFKSTIDKMLMSVPRQYTMEEIELFLAENGYPASKQTISLYKKHYITPSLNKVQERYAKLEEAVDNENLDTAERMKRKIELMMLSIDERDFDTLSIEKKISSLRTLSQVLKDMDSLSREQRSEEDKAAREFNNDKKLERLHNISREKEEADIRLKEQQMNTPATRHLKKE